MNLPDEHMPGTDPWAHSLARAVIASGAGCGYIGLQLQTIRDTALSINALHSRVLDGDTAAEEQLFERLSARFQVFAHHRIWNSVDAEDVAQEALLTIQSRYREIEIETSFTAWAHKVLDNKMLAYIEAKRRTGSRYSPLTSDESSDLATESDPLLRRRLLDCLRKLGRSNRTYARILALHYQGLSKQEICDRLSLTRNNSYVIMSRARAQLKDCIRAKGVSA